MVYLGSNGCPITTGVAVARVEGPGGMGRCVRVSFGCSPDVFLSIENALDIARYLKREADAIIEAER